MENFATVAAQVAVLFVLVAAGVACRFARLVDEASAKGIVNVLLYVVTPCLIVNVFQREFDRAMLAQLGVAFLVSALAHAAVIGVALALARGGRDALPVTRLAMVFSNAGFMGIPLEEAVFGPKGVFFGITYVATFNLFMWSWGLRTMRGGGWNARSLLPMFVNPGTVGLAIGLPLFLGSAVLPPVVGRPVEMMASLNTPLAMVVIGYYLAGARLGAVARFRPAYVAAFVRLVAYPLALTAALWPFRGIVDRTMALSVITGASAPVAAMVTMFAAKYNRDVDLSVGLVSATTLLSAFTMPAVIAVAMSVI